MLPWCVVPVLVVVAAGIGVVLSLAFSPQTVDDDKATHEQLAAEYGGTSWYPHVVAANHEHGALNVYLDTRNADLEAEACRDLPVPEPGHDGARVSYVADGRTRFERAC